MEHQTSTHTSADVKISLFERKPCLASCGWADAGQFLSASESAWPIEWMPPQRTMPVSFARCRDVDRVFKESSAVTPVVWGSSVSVESTLHYCSRNIWATYGLHMGHIWGPGLPLMELFQHMGKKILQKAQHMGNIWVSFSNIWGSFETYRSFLKHMGPFWNIWAGLSWKVFVSFADLPHCIIPVYEFFFSQKFCQSQIRPVPNISAKEKRLLEVSGRAWNLISTIKAGKPPAKNFKLILRLRFCEFVCMHTTPTTPGAPSPRHVHFRPALKSALKIALSLNFQFEQNRA